MVEKSSPPRRSYRPYHYFVPRLPRRECEYQQGIGAPSSRGEYNGDAPTRSAEKADEGSEVRAFMRDDPHRIAAWLIQEHGLEEARRMALFRSLQAQQQSNNYALSVWREVKRILAEQAKPQTKELV